MSEKESESSIEKETGIVRERKKEREENKVKEGQADRRVETGDIAVEVNQGMTIVCTYVLAVSRSIASLPTSSISSPTLLLRKREKRERERECVFACERDSVRE